MLFTTSPVFNSTSEYYTRGVCPEIKLEGNLQHHSLKHDATERAAVFDELRVRTGQNDLLVVFSQFFGRLLLFQITAGRFAVSN